MELSPQASLPHNALAELVDTREQLAREQLARMKGIAMNRDE
jgi:hypothetical protein